MTPQEYIDVLKTGRNPVPPPFVKGLCGRILRGKTPDHFVKLSDDPNRKVIMLTDSNGLSRFFGKSHYQMCCIVGHHPDHIKSKVNDGYTYKLVVFPESEAVVATWDGVFKVACEIYPALIPAIQQHGQPCGATASPSSLTAAPMRSPPSRPRPVASSWIATRLTIRFL